MLSVLICFNYGYDSFGEVYDLVNLEVCWSLYAVYCYNPPKMYSNEVDAGVDVALLLMDDDDDDDD